MAFPPDFLDKIVREKLKGTMRHTYRLVWLRRGAGPASRTTGDCWHTVSLRGLGTAAARETFTTATVPFAAVWTEMFLNMVTNDHCLRWKENGPGIGRDARIAYSGLLGRYMARSYLMKSKDVRVLVPLDTAKRYLEGTPYSIRKDPHDRGLEADWIGLDGNRLVIAEAKGTFDRAISAWNGPDRRPTALKTALGQAKRTAVYRSSSRPLPAKRWAVASRWATKENGLRPVLVAWDSDDGSLGRDDYRELDRILHRADIEEVLKGLGHPEAVGALDEGVTAGRLPGDIGLRVGEQRLDFGFAAVLGPGGLHPLRGREDLEYVRRVRELTPNVALVSLSSRYAGETDPERRRVADPEDGGNVATRAGLTVAWLSDGADIGIE